MGDNINMDWGTLGTAPNPNAFMQGYSNARTIQQNAMADNARTDALANPSDMNALTHLAVFNPQAAEAMRGQLDYQRAGMARQASANLFASYAQQPGQSSYGGPQANAMTPQAPQAAPQAPVDPLAALPAQNGQQAPQAAPQGQQGASPQQAGAVADPSHPVYQQIGAAAQQGRPVDPMKAWAAVAQYSNPADIEKLQTAIGSMDKLRLSRLEEANGALGTAAQTLLASPQEQRAALLQQIAPQLLQHGVTPDQLQQAASQGLTDQQLHGFAGQALGIQGLIAQTNKEREFGQGDQRIGIEQQNANTTAFTAQSAAAHNIVEEHKGTPDGFGNIIDPISGKVIYSQGGAGGSDVTSRILQLEGTAPNPLSSAKGPGQFLNAAFRQYIGGVSPGIAQQIAGMKDAQLSAFRASHADQLAPLQQQMTAQLTKDNQQVLSAKGVPVNDGNTYMAHVFGAGGAAAAINAGPNSSAAAFVGGAKALTNNGLPGNATVGQVQAWAAKKMAGAGGAGGMTGDAIEQAAQLGIQKFGGTPPPGFARNKAAMAAISNRIAGIMGQTGQTTGDALATSAGTHADTQSLATLNKRATIINASENAASSNADLALRKAGVNANGGIPLFNSWRNAANRSTGSPAIVGFNAAVETFANEYSKVMGGGIPTDSLRSHANSMINTAQSPGQFKEVISTLKQDMANQSAGYERERQATLGRISGRSAQQPAPQGGSKPAGATRTATGPGGARIALVSGQWVKY
jgi:hypothetical protein